MTVENSEKTTEANPTDDLSIRFPYEKLPSLLLRFLNRLKQTGKSTHTISAYRNDLSTFAEFLVEKKIDPRQSFVDVTQEWTAYLHERGRKSHASVRRAQMSVRTFLHFLAGEKIISGSPFLEVKSPTQPKHDLFLINHDQFLKLVKALQARAKEGDEKGIRDLSIALLLGECGLKASELASLTWKDLFLEPHGGTVRVPGQTERLLKLSLEARNSLCDLMTLREDLGLPTGPNAHLFFGYMNVSRKTRTDALHRHGIKFIVYEVCEEILKIPFNSESLRNHAVTHWLNQGLTAAQVAKLAGYSSLHSLERFGRETRRKARRHPRKKVEEQTSL